MNTLLISENSQPSRELGPIELISFRPGVFGLAMQHASTKITPMIPSECEMRDVAKFRFLGAIALGPTYAVNVGNRFLVLLDKVILFDEITPGLIEITAYVRFGGIVQGIAGTSSGTAHS